MTKLSALQANYNNLQKFIKVFDLFPETFSFYLHHRGDKSTVRGGLISIVVISLFLALSFIKVYGFVTNRQPSVINDLQSFPNRPPSEMKDNEFQYMLTLWNALTYQNVTIYSPSSETIYHYVNALDLTDILKVPIIGSFKPCSQNTTSSPLIANYLTKFSNSDIRADNFQCSDFNLSKFKMGGDLLNSGSSYSLDFRMNIDTCKFGLADCKDQEKMKQLSLSFYFFYKDNYLDLSSTKGYEGIYNYKTFDFIYGQGVNIKIFLIEYRMTTDDSYFSLGTGSDQETKFYGVDSISIAYSQSLSSDPTIFSVKIDVFLSTSVKKVTRNYPKFDVVLASINAYFSILAVVARMMVSLLNYGFLEKYLMKKLYHIPKEKKPKEVKIVRVRNKSLNTDFERSSDISIRKSEARLRVDRLSLDIKQLEEIVKGEEFRESYFKFVVNFFKCNRNVSYEFKSYLKAKTLLRFDLNIINLMRKWMDNEKAFLILFEPYQRNIFNMIQTRDLDPRKPIEELINPELMKMSKHGNLKSIYSDYRKCCNSDSSIDRKMIKLINYND